ncbi:hypothetical protein [Leptolyngbya sp. BL0902]|uniref:hypothetical protein n=1 Tax=Leptolyngbya sp. BL0902 TaxID=1115757 RepID=UPI0018E7CAF9|nr:hypothetical protein [Leptolyngbya sp. BL0902]
MNQESNPSCAISSKTNDLASHTRAARNEMSELEKDVLSLSTDKKLARLKIKMQDVSNENVQQIRDLCILLNHIDTVTSPEEQRRSIAKADEGLKFLVNLCVDLKAIPIDREIPSKDRSIDITFSGLRFTINPEKVKTGIQEWWEDTFVSSSPPMLDSATDKALRELTPPRRNQILSITLFLASKPSKIKESDSIYLLQIIEDIKKDIESLVERYDIQI